MRRFKSNSKVGKERGDMRLGKEMDSDLDQAGLLLDANVTGKVECTCSVVRGCFIVVNINQTFDSTECNAEESVFAAIFSAYNVCASPFSLALALALALLAEVSDIHCNKSGREVAQRASKP